MKTEDIVKDIVRFGLSIPAEREIRNEDHLEDDLGADSLDLVEIVMRIEEECDVVIPDEDGENVKTVGDLIKLTEDNIKEKKRCLV